MSEPEYLTSRSQELARHLAGCTSSPEDKDRIARTGEIFPPTSLRFKELRRKLKWVLELNSDRYFTLKRVTQAIQILLQEKHFSLPVQVPGFNEGEWVENQSKRLTKLLQRARKSIDFGAMDPDNVETQVWQQDCPAWVLVLFNFCDMIMQESESPVPSNKKTPAVFSVRML